MYIHTSTACLASHHMPVRLEPMTRQICQAALHLKKHDRKCHTNSSNGFQWISKNPMDYQNIPHSKTIWGVYPNFRQTQMRTMIMRHLLEEPDLTPREACPHTGNKFPALQSIQHSSTWFNSVSFELRLCRHPGRLRHLWSCCSRLGPAISTQEFQHSTSVLALGQNCVHFWVSHEEACRALSDSDTWPSKQLLRLFGTKQVMGKKEKTKLLNVCWMLLDVVGCWRSSSCSLDLVPCSGVSSHVGSRRMMRDVQVPEVWPSLVTRATARSAVRKYGSWAFPRTFQTSYYARMIFLAGKGETVAPGCDSWIA